MQDYKILRIEHRPEATRWLTVSLRRNLEKITLVFCKDGSVYCGEDGATQTTLHDILLLAKETTNHGVTYQPTPEGYKTVDDATTGETLTVKDGGD